MGIPWKTILQTGLNVVSMVNPAVGAVVQAVEAIKGLHGVEKQNAAVQMLIAGLKAVESVTDKDLLNDPEFEAILRDAIDIEVRFQNLKAKQVPA